MSKQTISISTGTIVRTIFILLIVGFLFLVKDVIILFFVAVILASAFDPLIDWLQTKKIPRTVSIIGVYMVFLTLVGWSLYLLAGPIVEQVKEIGKAFPDFYSKLADTINYLRSVDQSVARETVSTSFADITKSLTSATSGIFRTVTSIFGGVFSFLMVLVVTFYLTVEENAMKRFIKTITPSNNQAYIDKLITDMQHRMGYWLRGQLFLSIIVFAMVYIGLSLMGIKYALILALVAGIFEIVPFLGPWISAIPGVFFAFSQSPGKAIAVAILYFLVQQVENNLIVPKVMGKTTGLNPLVVILAILTGARLGGVVGALLAVPVTLALTVYVESILDKRKK
ncbi:AI-2E family transporter [Patescibacteria group bacterium]|nr:AI-2E family transporter [Patescibacteria group bacterium]